MEIGGDALNTPDLEYRVWCTDWPSPSRAAVHVRVADGSRAATADRRRQCGAGLSGIAALGKTLGSVRYDQSLALMLGLAVSIDYALFIVSRYREERAQGQAPAEAAAYAAGTAGSAVVFAGTTVVIALAGLSVVGIPTLTKTGLAAAAAIARRRPGRGDPIPALLGFFPRARHGRAARRAARRADRGGGRTAPRTKPNLGSRWGGFLLRRPLPVLLLAAAALA